MNNTTAAEILTRGESYLLIRGWGCLTFAVLGALVNLTALVLLVKYASIRGSTQMTLVVCMCGTNLAYCVTVLPVFAYIQLRGGPPAFGGGDGVWCRMHGYFSGTMQGCVISALFLITLHRYFLVIHPNSRYFSMGTWKRALAITFTMYGLLHVALAGPLFNIMGRYGYDALILNCTAIRDESRIFYMFFMLLGFVLPITMKAIAYIRIFVTVYRQRKRIMAMNDNRKQKSNGAQLRLSIVCCVLVLVFVLSYLPFTLATVIVKLEQNDYVHAISTILMPMHCVLNPVVYLYGDGKLRAKIMARNKFVEEKTSITCH